MDKGLALLIPLLPLLGFIVLGLMKGIPRKAVAAIATGTILTSFLIGLVLFVQQPADGAPVVHRYFTWLQAGDFRADFAFQLDRLSLLMVLIVTGVGTLIHWYASAYMLPHDEHAHDAGHHDAHPGKRPDDGGYSRFFSYLNLFASLMLILVLAANFALMFVGWEGVGLASYLLIGFYYERWSATQAGKKAFLVNRVGDFFFMTGLFLLIASPMGTIPQADGTTLITTDYVLVFSRAAELLAGPNFILRTEMVALTTAITLLMFLGATGKSAQLPLFVWLPDAMEGPTPVSALIHAATMVTAGVYLLVRANILFLMSPITMAVVAVVALLTALMAAAVALTQYDIKRVLAYSTISQLGFMFIAAGLGALIPAIFHLMTHAFFKACLFLGAGSVIHGMEHATGSHDPSVTQDMRHMGGLAKQMPTTHLTMLISTAAIAGFPLTAGFFSKDAILHEGYLLPFVPEWLRIAVVTIAYGVAFLTAVYMFRMYYLTFGGTYRGVPAKTYSAHGHRHEDFVHGEAIESPPQMTIPLQVLALLAMVSGFLMFAPVFMPFEDYLKPVVHDNMLLAAATREGLYGEAAQAAIGHHAGEAAEGEESHATTATVELPHPDWGNSLPFYIVSTLIALAGISLAKGIWGTDPSKTASWKRRYAGLHSWASRAWRIDEGYHRAFIIPGTAMFHNLWVGMDEGMIDDTLVEGTARGAGVIARGLRVVQSGYLRAYATYIVLGVVVMLLITLAARRGG